MSGLKEVMERFDELAAQFNFGQKQAVYTKNLLRQSLTDLARELAGAGDDVTCDYPCNGWKRAREAITAKARELGYEI